MRIFLTVILSLFLFIGCSSSNEPFTWNLVLFSRNDTTSGKTYTEVIYPLFTDGPNYDSVNARIDFLIRKHICGEDPRFANMKMQEAIDSLLAWKNRDSVLRQVPYDTRFHSYIKECGDVIALRCTIYKKTGDDNGTINTYVYNIHRGGTRFLTQDEIISDTISLKKLNQTYFSRYLIDKVIPEKVLFVPVDELPLPQNISVDSTGVYMQYNPDEVAPPNVGAIEYYVPYEEAEPALKRIVRK